MNSLHTNLRINQRGFTLVEILVATVLVGAVGAILFSVMISTLKLSSKNAVTNVSNFRARQTLDRIGEIVRYAQETPVLINANGTTASGTTADGLLVKNSLGGPYVFKNANGQAAAEIPADAKSFVVEYASANGVSAPSVGDFFSVTLSTRPQLEVLTVGSATTSAGISKVLITTRQALGEVAKPASYTVSASSYRKEAFIFAQSGSYWNLRHYSPVTGSTNFSDGSAFRAMGGSYKKLGTESWFSAPPVSSGTQYIWLRALARSSSKTEHAESSTGKNTLTSLPIQIKLWNYQAPPPQ